MDQVLKDREKMVRTQILLRRDQQEALGRIAARQGVSKSALIREAVEELIEEETVGREDWDSAIDASHGLWTDFPDWEERYQALREDWKRRMERLWSEP